MSGPTESELNSGPDCAESVWDAYFPENDPEPLELEEEDDCDE